MAQTGRRPSRKQPGNKLNASGRHFKDGLVDEVFQHILAPDIKDEGYSRPERGDITKILLRSNTQIDPAGFCRFFQLGDKRRKFRSFDMYWNRKDPASSEKPVTMRQKPTSGIWAGRVSAGLRDNGMINTARATAKYPQLLRS